MKMATPKNPNQPRRPLSAEAARIARESTLHTVSGMAHPGGNQLLKALRNLKVGMAKENAYAQLSRHATEQIVRNTVVPKGKATAFKKIIAEDAELIAMNWYLAFTEKRLDRTGLEKRVRDFFSTGDGANRLQHAGIKIGNAAKLAELFLHAMAEAHTEFEKAFSKN